ENETALLTKGGQRGVEMMLVAGFSGIGKTAVVNEVHKPIVRQRGYFIKGKFDQFQRNIPFSAFVQAFRDLMGQLLSESDTQLQKWKAEILAAVGDNGQVLIDVIPELEKIIGKQPPATELSGSAAQNRFNLLFQKFVQVFTSKEHPLVMFLDDLQWSDSASLNLLKLLLQDTGHLLILGAYRNNEVSPVHPFILTVDEIVKTGATVNTITLAPLSELNLNRLVADTLNCELYLAKPLTRLVYQKTQGNPFFATQFLKALHDDKLITFNPIQSSLSQGKSQGRWQCDIAEVKALALTDDVVEFMALQLQKLETETQEILKLAACIGAEFDLNTLVIVSEKSVEVVVVALWQALEEGLVIPRSKIYKFFSAFENEEVLKNSANPTYHFLHDRVQQAAYSLIAEAEKPTTHFKIGQLLRLEGTAPEEQEEKLFAIVNQLNKGRELLESESQRQELAELNLRSGKKAKTSTAIDAAVKYLIVGLELLPENSWQSHYELTLKLHVEAAEVEYLNTNFERAEQLVEIVLQQATSLLDKVKVYELKIQFAIAQNQMLKAIETGTRVVELLGVQLSPLPGNDSTEKFNLPRLEDLENFPIMTDPYKLAAMRILMNISAAAVIANSPSIMQIVLTMLALCIEEGHSAVAAIAYVDYGMILSGVMGELDTGYYAGQLSLRLLEQFNVRELKSKVYAPFNGLIRHWKEHTVETLAPLIEGFHSGLETGDMEYAGICALHYSGHIFWVGKSLELVANEQLAYIGLMNKLKQEFPAKYIENFHQLTLNLQGLSSNKFLLIGESFDETAMLPYLQTINNSVTLFAVYVNKTILCYLFKDFPQAIDNALLALEQIASGIGLMTLAVCNFYYSLSLLANYNNVEPTEQEQYLLQVEENQKKMQHWAHHAPFNYQHKYDLVEAEKARILGQKAEAMDLYDRAITGAKNNGYIQEEALANELAGEFYLNWGKEKIATIYMQEAYYGYARWGAKAKTDDLEKRYPQLLRSLRQKTQQSLHPQETIVISDRAIDNNIDNNYESSSSRSSSVSQVLDLATILKACQAISSEIQQDKLLAKLTQVLMENAGATKCALILPSDSDWQIEALATVEEAGEVTNLSSQPLETTNDLPISLVRYVVNTSENLVFDEIIKEERWSRDRYIQTSQPKSVLCLPILQQSTIRAILYLENNRTAAAFTPRQQEILKLLSTQISISIENASLYSNLEQKVEKRTAQLTASEAKLQEAHKLARLGNWEWDLITNELYWSDEIYQIFGLEKQPPETLFEKHKKQIHPEDFQIWLTGLEQLQSEGKPYDFDFRIIHRDGKLRYIYAKGQAAKDADGKVIKIFGTAQDISDRKLIEEALRSSEKQLREKATELEQTLQELRQTQSQLIQTEKMSSLGEMVAGVAHEINNPVSFIYSNIEPASQYVSDLLDLIRIYQNSYPTPTPEIAEKIEDLELEFLAEDLPKLLGSMKNGAKRIRDIVASLRNFSRLDESEIKEVDIHEGIESTLLILQYRLHGFQGDDTAPKLSEIMVIKNYRKLPLVVCYPNQLNQVFLNIFNNAIDALNQVITQGENADFQPTITITTTAPEPGFIEIKIADNGLGISPAIVSRIFDPFFTTKPVGSGTGLGLYVSYQIVVDRHRGKLICVSNPGVGTEFTIKLANGKNN
ncbi:hypothetical protein BCD67_07880, partial [Oscillatoriales cyanobacterium USR001]